MRMKTGNSIVLLMLTAFFGCVTEPEGVERIPSAPRAEPEPSVACPRRIPPRISRWLAKANVDFRQTEDGSGIYRLTLTSPDPISADRREYVQTYFRDRVAESFAKGNALEPRQVAVAILSERMEMTAYCGEATACGVNDISLAYDPDTRKGILAMKIRNGDFDGTRKLIRRHIEGIVRDKNIRLVAGVQPPPGRYYLLGETVKPGNVLEIEFKSE